jgi:signal transduction histidine kinase
LVWAFSTYGQLPGFGAAVSVTLLAAWFLVRETWRREQLEAQRELLLGQLEESRAARLEAQQAQATGLEQLMQAQAALDDERQRLSAWQHRAWTLQAALDDARSSRASFLATVSHELRTPLHAIIGFTELVTDGLAGPVNEKQLEYLGDGRAAAQHLLRLITDVLDYAKSDAGRLSFAKDPVGVAAVVDEVTTLIDSLAAKKELTVTVSCDEGLTLVGDALRVKQVLLNLVGNAVKFTPRRGRVELIARAVDERCEFVVRDTGPGIAKEEQDAVFEPFHQADSSTARTHAGTGLGLALVKRWAEAMGGAVELVSEAGQGSTFTVWLPLASRVTPLKRPGHSWRPGVLVAEDDDATRVMLSRVLEANGCDVRQAPNGQRALEQLMEHLPAVVVLDLMMPELDGYELLKKLRALPDGHRVKVLVFSATNPQGDERDALTALGAEVLLKGSLTPGELAHKVHLLSEPMRSAA